MSADDLETQLAASVAKPKSGGGRPARYRLKDGTIVPGVTSCLIYKDPGPLMFWANKLGLEGKDFRDERDKATDTGHQVHAWIEADIHGEPVDIPEDVPGAAAFGAFRDWRESVRLEIIATEVPLVSELHRYGGCYDALARVNGRVVLLDWKAANGIYPEYVAQLAAYRQLIRENTKDRSQAPDSACLLRVEKKFGSFHYHFFPSEALDLGWERFSAAKWMYEVDAKLKGVV